MGVILQSLGRVADALAAYEDALRWSPAHCEALTKYWLRVFPTEETYLQALVIANLLLLPPDPV